MATFHCLVIFLCSITSGGTSSCAATRRALVALATVLSLLPFTRTLGEPVTCDVPSVAPLTQTWLTCYFPDNAGHSKTNITVYHYVNHSRPESILDCWWLGGQLDCSTKGRFQFDKVTTDRLSVWIPSASASQRGQYACQVAGYNSENLQRCEFVLARENQVACEIFSRDETTQSDLTCYFPEDVSVSKKDFTVYHYTGKSRPDPVVDCLWHRGILRCFTEPGYVFDMTVTDTLTVQIPYISDNRTGDYTCHISGSRTEDLNVCQLFVQMTERPSHYGLPTSAHHEEHHFEWKVGLAVGVFILLLLALPAAWKMRRRCTEFCHRQSGVGQNGSASGTNAASSCRKAGSRKPHILVKYQKAANAEAEPQLRVAQSNRNQKTKETFEIEADDQVTWTYKKKHETLDDEDDVSDAEDRRLT